MITEKERLQARVEVLKELRIKLNGVCGYACPRNLAVLHRMYNEDVLIKYGTAYRVWDCINCVKNFSFISCLDHSTNCPCGRESNPEELFLRLDEVIEETEERLNALR